MYHFFAEPVPLAVVAPCLLPIVGRFTSVVGHSFFGDLFLRDLETGEYAILITCTLEFVDSGEFTESGFREQILANPEVIRTLLRPEDAVAVARRVGLPGQGEALFPVPLPAFGGPDDLETYQRGGLWEYLGIVAQSSPAVGNPGASPEVSGHEP